MTQDQSMEMQDKTDGGCLSPADEEREPCLKETVAAAEKNNGVAAAPAAAAAATAADDQKRSADNNNSNGKFQAFAAASGLERKLRDKTGFSRTGLVVAAVAMLLCVVLTAVLIVMAVKWPPRPARVCRRASCLRASAEVNGVTTFSHYQGKYDYPPPVYRPKCRTAGTPFKNVKRA